MEATPLESCGELSSRLAQTFTNTATTRPRPHWSTPRAVVLRLAQGLPIRLGHESARPSLARRQMRRQCAGLVIASVLSRCLRAPVPLLARGGNSTCVGRPGGPPVPAAFRSLLLRHTLLLYLAQGAGRLTPVLE